MEFAEWIAFAGLEPIGDRRGDVQAALICKILVDLNRKQGAPPSKIDSFMLDYGDTEAIEMDDDMIAMQADVLRAYLDAEGTG